MGCGTGARLSADPQLRIAAADSLPRMGELRVDPGHPRVFDRPDADYGNSFRARPGALWNANLGNGSRVGRTRNPPGDAPDAGRNASGDVPGVARRGRLVSSQLVQPDASGSRF